MVRVRVRVKYIVEVRALPLVPYTPPLGVGWKRASGARARARALPLVPYTPPLGAGWKRWYDGSMPATIGRCAKLALLTAANHRINW